MGKALIPAQGEKRSDVMRVALLRADRLLALWSKDFRTMPREELVTLIQDAAATIHNSGHSDLVTLLAEPATDEDVGREVFDLLGSFFITKDESFAIFSRNLTIDMAEKGVPLAVLTATMKHVRQTLTRRPAIAEVLAVLSEKRQAFEDRASLIQKAPQRLVLAREVLEARDRG